MKLQFDSNQQYQWDAIKSITDIFEGQPLCSGDFEFIQSAPGTLLTENGFGNNLTISEEQILQNVKAIQQHHGIKEPVSELQGLNFSVEMETGTGKTYVYLKTIYELNKLYGFKKFVIVVPSVAIREGVLKNLQITQDHFQSLYDKTSIGFEVYDSKKVSTLRSFSSANNIQILIINIQAFNTEDRIINKPNDKLTGKIPIEFIQGTKPIVIVDEPQNMEAGAAKTALNKLYPLCTLRYSATHTNLYNLMYSLNPVKAYDLGLVKQIEVDSIMSENDFNDAFIQLESVNRAGNNITAKIKIDTTTTTGIKRKAVTVNKNKLDLYELSGQNVKYEGIKIYEIDFGNQQIELTNGIVLKTGESQGGMNDEVMRYMIQKTVEEHLKKEKEYKAKGIKVLTLFFIDKVKNYREYDESGNPIKGKFANWFEEIFQNEINKPKYRNLVTHTVQDIHNGYFSQDSKGRVKDTGGETQADDDTYKLIMQEKEKLLDLNTPLRFIFSHSALREGWDNPNVFQICTLNETRSEIKKRQEIGRGLRLSVNQEGKRIFDRNINRLTIIANERYEAFATALQKEIETDCGVSFAGRIKDYSKKKKLNYRKGFEADPRFLQLWEKIKHHTKYNVAYQTSELITLAAKAMKEMGETKKPTVRSTKNEVVMGADGVTGNLLSDTNAPDYALHFEIPDMLAYIQGKTELTRSTILDIVKKSGKISELLINPQMFMDNTTSAIKSVLYELMIDGIKYEKIGSQVYEMKLFDDGELEIYLDQFTFEVNRADKTIYENYIPLDSNIENQFAKDCESSENVEFYFKLPDWFKIPTPIGNYVPDWALVFKGEKKIYFVAETKSDGQELRGSEFLKIKCGKAHFNNFDNVVYKKVTSVRDLNN
ncbi:MAG TPA: DEAD/DEAH box helicase family protein [Chitinophagaceae bacterium]|nr:DEAD/DEAH box helicase family protein [Chitinophagaceae bacterium]